MGSSCNVLGCLLYQCSYEFLEKRLLERGKDQFSLVCSFTLGAAVTTIWR